MPVPALFPLTFFLCLSSLSSFSSSTPPLHGVFDRTATLSLLGKWRPQVVGEHLVSLSGVQRYTTARLQLAREEDRDAPRMGVLDEHHNLFLVARPTNDTASLTTVLWRSSEEDRDARFVALRRWHAVHHPDVRLLGEEMVDDEDRAMWQLSLEDDDDPPSSSLVARL